MLVVPPELAVVLELVVPPEVVVPPELAVALELVVPPEVVVPPELAVVLELVVPPEVVVPPLSFDPFAVLLMGAVPLAVPPPQPASAADIASARIPARA